MFHNFLSTQASHIQTIPFRPRLSQVPLRLGFSYMPTFGTSRPEVYFLRRPITSYHVLNCYFCKTYGTRIILSVLGKPYVSVEGDCIEGLDYSSGK